MIPFILVSLLAYINLKSEIENIVTNQLTSIREIKALQIEDYFLQINDQVTTFANNTMIQDAAIAFKKDFKEASKHYSQSNKENVEEYFKKEFLPKLNKNLEEDLSIDSVMSTNPGTLVLQDAYIASNTNNVGEKDSLITSTFNLDYDKTHETYHPIIREYLSKFGYYDIFIVDDLSGDIVCSVFKEADYATNLLDGVYKDSNIANVYKEALDLEKGEFVVEDFDFYNPSYHAPASFIASPIYEGNKRVGVLIFQMPVDKINSIMTSNESWSESGLGLSGETYLVADDLRLRSISRFLIEDMDGYINALEHAGVNSKDLNSIRSIGTSVLLQPADTIATQEAFNGLVDTLIIKDYRDVSVLSSFKLLNIEGLNYAILSEIDEAEAFESIYQLRLIMVIIGLVAASIIIVTSVVIALGLSKPLVNTVNILKDISEGEGDLTHQLSEKRSDEIGQVSKWFNLFTNKLRDIIMQIIGQTSQLKTNVDSFDLLMKDSNENLDDIISSVAIVNESIQNNASISEEANASIEELSSTASSIYSQAIATKEKGELVNSAVVMGQSSIEEVVLSINDVKNSSEDVTNVLSDLSKSIDSINSIIS